MIRGVRAPEPPHWQQVRSTIRFAAHALIGCAPVISRVPPSLSLCLKFNYGSLALPLFASLPPLHQTTRLTEASCEFSPRFPTEKKKNKQQTIVTSTFCFAICFTKEYHEILQSPANCISVTGYTR